MTTEQNSSDEENGNGNNNNGNCNGKSRQECLSYMDEMRLAKFARSHRNLGGLMGSAHNGTAGDTQQAVAAKMAADNRENASIRRRIREEGAHAEDYGVHHEDEEICGGIDLSESMVHNPHHEEKKHGQSSSVRTIQNNQDRRKFLHRRNRTENDDQVYKRLSMVLGPSEVVGGGGGGNRRSSGLANAAAWKSVMQGLEGIEETDSEGKDGEDDEEEHHHHHIPFYDYPVQRQRWGDPQLLPHINWGDLFFDLFYVGIAYNLGTLLISVLTPYEWKRGLVYFLGIFGPLYNMWERKMNYEARYVVLDYVHRIFEAVRVFLLGFAALHINSVTLMKDPKSAETFALNVSIFLESMIHVALKVELILVGRGDRTAIVNHSKRKLYKTLLPLSSFYLAAVVVSGILYFGPYTPATKEDAYASSSYNDYNETTSGHDDDHRRYLADEPASSGSAEWAISDLPYALCFIGYFFDILFAAFRKLVKFDPKKLDVRDHFVPTNIDFQIHRYGEFTMLMLGESVLSLVIVETTELSNYYLTACVGIVNVIVIQALKFDSEPSNADNHCLWRGVKAAFVYSLLIQLLSISLIGFGVSFKVMLATIYSDGDYTDADEAATTTDAHRLLAGVPDVTFLAIKCLYSASLTLVLGSIELLASSHKGFKQQYKVFVRHDKTGGLKINWRVVFITTVKLFLLTFVATLPKWLGDHRELTVIGLVVSIVFALSRIIDWGYETDHHVVKKLHRAMAKANKVNLRSMASNVASYHGSTFMQSLKRSGGSSPKDAATTASTSTLPEPAKSGGTPLVSFAEEPEQKYASTNV